MLENRTIPESRARRILAFGATVLLIAICLALLVSMPSVEEQVARAPGISFLGVLLRGTLILLVIGGLTTWAGALLYAYHSTSRSPLPRVLLFAVLTIGNAAAGFFYYWLYVHWLRVEPPAQRQATGPV